MQVEARWRAAARETAAAADWVEKETEESVAVAAVGWLQGAAETQQWAAEVAARA